jgi:hypothetical protein
MEAFKDIGSKGLNLIMGLPPLSITDGRVYEAFHELEKKTTTETCVQIVIKSKKKFKLLGDDSYYVIKFLTKKEGKTARKDFNHLEIVKKTPTSYYSSKKITSRLLISKTENRIYSCDNKPVPKLMLNILFSFLDSPEKFIAGFGSEVLECKRCGAILTATKSLNAKYGPICSKHKGIQY